MGRIVTVSCEKCDYQKTLYTGGGLRDCDIEAIRDILTDVGRRRLDICAAEGIVRISVDRRTGVCKSCRELASVPVITCETRKGQRSFADCCPDCGSADIELLAEGGEAAHVCPVCGSLLSLREEGYWD